MTWRDRDHLIVRYASAARVFQTTHEVEVSLGWFQGRKVQIVYEPSLKNVP